MKLATVLLFATALLFCFAGLALADDSQATPESFPKIKADGTIGYNLTGGNIKTDAAAGSAEFIHEDVWVNDIVKAGVNFSNVSYFGRRFNPNVNNYFGNYKFEGFVTKEKKPYLWAFLGYDSNEFIGYWNRYTGQAGPGYSFFGTDPTVLKLEVGYGFVDTVWAFPTEIDNNPKSMHIWEPTHNLMARLVFAYPYEKKFQIAEEASYRVNMQWTYDQEVDSATNLTFALTSRLSFRTTFTLQFLNNPGFVQKQDENGVSLVTSTGAKILTKSQRMSYSWINGLLVSFL
jgi:putative salt-induced outer membrane protein YdiY